MGDHSSATGQDQARSEAREALRRPGYFAAKDVRRAR
jgi:hypothetical protein